MRTQIRPTDLAADEIYKKNWISEATKTNSKAVWTKIIPTDQAEDVYQAPKVPKAEINQEIKGRGRVL